MPQQSASNPRDASIDDIDRLLGPYPVPPFSNRATAFRRPIIINGEGCYLHNETPLIVCYKLLICKGFFTAVLDCRITGLPPFRLAALAYAFSRAVRSRTRNNHRGSLKKR